MKYDSTEGRLRGRRNQERRLRLWTKDPRCAQCRRLTDYPQGFQVDHEVPLFKGGEDTDENCQVLCQDCHDAKTNEDLGRRQTQAIGPDGWPIKGPERDDR